MPVEEIVLGDLIREIGLDQAYKLGYYEGHRLWLIFNELRSRDLENFWRVLDAANATQDYRNSIDEWLKSGQPRRYPKQEHIPEEVWKRIRDAWDSGG